LALVELSGLGRAAKVIVGQDMTTIIPLNEENPALDEHIAKLNESRSLSTNPRDIEFIDERIANINGGIGIIYVGANSDIEQKELRDRIDDSVCAVRAAIEEGILPGGGIALINVCRHIKDSEDTDMNTAVEIMMNAVMEPFMQIINNAGIDPMSISLNIIGKGDGYGFNVKTKQYGDMMSMGIIDPAKVTKNALKNAVSVATTILNSSVIVTNIREYEGNR
jgi:chaperonin GroEL